MDLKLLLLKSLSCKKPISGSHRIYYGNSCFVIKYVINGKVLSFKNIKSIRKRITWSQRIKSYNRFNKIHLRMKNSVHSKRNLSTTSISNFDDKCTMTEHFRMDTQDAHMQTVQITVPTKDTSAQTIVIEKHSREIQTESFEILPNIKDIKKLDSTTRVNLKQNDIVSFISRAQQTIASVKYNRSMAPVNHKANSRNSSRSCQTDSNTECKAIQCKRYTQTKATNTDVNTRNSFTQSTQSDPLGGALEATKLLALPRKDFEVFIYMLNEIGETVVNQNQVLNNNSEMMNQIMQTSMELSSKHMSQSCSSISTQTEHPLKIEMKNNYSQTKANFAKSRKLLLFKGRNSQHNK